MDKSGWIMSVIFIIVLLSLIGGAILLGNKLRDESVASCEYDANLLGVVSRYYKSVCQFQTEQGVWLPEHEYLLIAATECK